jgi:ABC-type oligopeptide transport system substrate-binding subunit
LIASASRTRDPERRAALLRECERMVVLDDAIILPVYVYSVTNLYDDTQWAGLEPDLLNSLDLRRVRPVRAEVSR